MKKYKVISICKVIGESYITAENIEQAKKRFNLGFSYDYNEIDSYDEEIDSIEEIKEVE